jgi:hypothetical protein
MSERRHASKKSAAGVSSAGLALLKRNPIWTLAAAGGIALVGILTGLSVSRPGGKTGALEDLVRAQQVREQELGPANRHRDIDIRMDDLRALHNDPGFAKLPAQKQEYVRGRLEELAAYRDYERKLATIKDLREVRSQEQLDRIRAELAALKVPAEYLVEWSDTDAYRHHAELVEDGQALQSALEETKKAYTDLIRDGNHVIEASAEANLPRRAQGVLDRAKQLPHPARDRDKMIPRSRRITYATVFQFPEVTALIGNQWQELEQRLKPLLDSVQP